MSDIPEISEKQLQGAISARRRARLIRGDLSGEDDIVALRHFVGLSQMDFARALGISVHTLRNWEQGRRKPDGPALALLKIAARHPRIIHENLVSVA
ncbi:MAG: helix-turn-helix domain-containing protein [Pseudohaliea sp.]